MSRKELLVGLGAVWTAAQGSVAQAKDFEALPSGLQVLDVKYAS